MANIDDDDLSDEDLTDEEFKKIQNVGCKAEEKIIETFVKNVPVPSLAECEEAISCSDQAHDVTADILVEFKQEEHEALKHMWENCFSEDAVRSYGDMGHHKCVMFQYAVNRIFRKLAYDNKQHVKDKRIRYKGYSEYIDATMVLCMVNKTHICNVWNI